MPPNHILETHIKSIFTPSANFYRFPYFFFLIIWQAPIQTFINYNFSYTRCTCTQNSLRCSSVHPGNRARKRAGVHVTSNNMIRRGVIQKVCTLGGRRGGPAKRVLARIGGGGRSSYKLT